MQSHRSFRRWSRNAGVAITVFAALSLSLPSTASGNPGQDRVGPPAWHSANEGFVNRDGARLMLHGKPFRFAGTNLYWLGLDENVGGVDYPTFFRIRDALDTAKAMGLTVVRSHMLTSTGNPKSLLPSREAGFNEAAFATVDYAIAYAGSLGIRLVLPMTDEWDYYHGGRRDFTEPYGLPPEAFYSDTRVIADYQAYVSHLMNRVNKLTGLAYRDDPTIMAWELGNELEGMTPEWIRANAEFFHKYAPRQLVAAGRRFDIDPDTLADPGIDIVDVHYYPPTSAKVTADAATVAAAGKAYIAGEYASNAASAELLKPLTANPNVTGMMSWSLFGHDDRRGFVQHDDGFTTHYPGDNARMAQVIDAQIAYAQALKPRLTRFVVGQPLITGLTKRGGINVLQWRGTAGAAGYRVERAVTERGRWSPAHRGLLTDNQTPWTDTGRPGSVWYRVVAVDQYGHTGPPSDAVFAGAGDTVLVDPVETLTIAAEHTAVAISPTAEGAIVRPSGLGPATMTWRNPNTRLARFDTAGGQLSGLTIQLSDDGAAWRTVHTRTEPIPGSRDHHASTARIGGAEWVRLTWSGPEAPGLTRATFTTGDPAPARGRPGIVEPLTPAPGASRVIGPDVFSWTTATDAGYYSLVVSTRPDLREPVLSVTGLAGTTYSPEVDLASSTTYYWRVTSTNAQGTTIGPVAPFTTRELPTTPVIIDDFESFASSEALVAAYPRNTGGDLIVPSLVSAPTGGGHAMQLDTTAGSAGYAGITRTFTTPIDMWGQHGIQFWTDRSATEASLTVQFVAHGIYWEYTLPAGHAVGPVQIPFTEFKQPSWAPSGALDLLNFQQISFYVGSSDSGRLVIDDIAAYPGE